MKITKEIRQAIKDAVEDSGSILQFSKRVNVAHTTVMNWASGKTYRMAPNTWNKLFPLIRNFLPPDQNLSEIIDHNESPTITAKAFLQEILSCNQLDDRAKIIITQLFFELEKSSNESNQDRQQERPCP